MQAVLFDMDGVLVDVSGSFRRAIEETTREFTGRAVPPGRVQAMKDGGGYNDDWTLTHALVREAGVEVERALVVEAFQARYRGVTFGGYIAHEPPMLRTETLVALAARYPLALVTGRPEAEARWTLERFGWGSFFPVVVAMEHTAGRGKPDPYGLRLALAALGVGAAESIYVGDMADDARAARAAGMRALGVVPPGLDFRAHGHTLLCAGAEAVVSSPDALPLLLRTLDAE